MITLYKKSKSHYCLYSVNNGDTWRESASVSNDDLSGYIKVAVDDSEQIYGVNEDE